jgi:CRP/FNR family transcriptional regulator, anaerobic regulatory protein
MVENTLADHLGHYIDLTANEQAALAAMCVAERAFRKGAVIRAEHAAASDMMIVQRGWIYSSLNLEDGRRQIVRLHFRGDLIGTDMLAYGSAPDATVALTEAVVCMLDRAAFGRLFVDHPRLAAAIFLLQQIDRVTLLDRLVSIGRSSAKGRLAALLLWIADRLRVANSLSGDSFALPLTQEEIGDLTGLTAVHVNRTMRVLVEQGLVTRSGGTVTILDRARLAAIANYIGRVEQFDAGWLPAAR